MSCKHIKRQWRVRQLSDVHFCAGKAREIAGWLGFTERAKGALTIAIGELVSNAVKFADGGQVSLVASCCPKPRIRLVVSDEGPGIANLSLALADHHSEGRALSDADLFGKGRRGGLGNGLGAVWRLMDEVAIESSVGQGTRIVAVKGSGAPVAAVNCPHALRSCG